MSGNPIVVEDCERASDLLTSPKQGSPRSADDLLREIDELHSALQGEKEKNKDLLQERDRGAHEMEEVFGLLYEEIARVRSKLATAETTIRLLEQRQVPECPICREAVCGGVTQCGHQFCKDCYDLWYQEQHAEGAAHSCPICRADLKNWNGKLFIKMRGTG